MQEEIQKDKLSLDAKFTKEHLVCFTNEEGHFDLRTAKGRTVLTIMHPVQINEQPVLQSQIDEAIANIRLHQNAVNLYEALEEVHNALKDLKSGKVSIFKFNINDLIYNSAHALKRASEKD